MFNRAARHADHRAARWIIRVHRTRPAAAIMSGFALWITRVFLILLFLGAILASQHIAARIASGLLSLISLGAHFSLSVYLGDTWTVYSRKLSRGNMVITRLSRRI
jgi:hypothetical protein